MTEGLRVSDGFTGELTERLDRLRLSFNKKSGGVSGGIRRSNEKGSSNEFSDFRSYTDGDSLRYVDWNSYARLGRLFVKLYMEEKQSIVNVIADCSASMSFDNKDYVSGLLCACLCYAALGGGDRARLEMGGSSLSVSAKAELSKMLGFVDSAVYRDKFDPVAAVKNMPLNQKGRFILISDFMYPTEETENAVKYLAYKKQELTLVMITSPQENEPQLNGELTLTDSENGEKINVEITDTVVSAYKNALKAHKGKISALCRKYGAEFTDIRADDNFTAILGKILR